MNKGDKIKPIKLWNQTERPYRHIDDETEILDITNAQSQTGIMFKIKLKNGDEVWLDSAWFEGF